MHKLDRSQVAAPTCLGSYQHGTHNWNDVSQAHKQEIRACLSALQDVRCAYCEGHVYSGGHIEHFRRKNPLYFPHLTFVWTNLFLSCDSLEHCGHFKDRPSAAAYDPNDLVKPDQHEPDKYFYFHSSGEVRPRSNTAEDEEHCAFETIRVFNLNNGALAAARRRALKMYEQSETGILETLMLFDDEARTQFIAEEIQATREQPHWTVIRHYFEKVS